MHTHYTHVQDTYMYSTQQAQGKTGLQSKLYPCHASLRNAKINPIYRTQRAQGEILQADPELIKVDASDNDSSETV